MPTSLRSDYPINRSDLVGHFPTGSSGHFHRNTQSLTPGRYVGVAPREEDADFDFEEALKNVHIELEGLNSESTELAAIIAKNFLELGV